jgi:dTDP-4-amino-4,6-dideoxygalactose transaminase
MTFVATANAVILSGAIPVFADVEIDTMNIAVDSIKNKITSKTRAILPVHFAGRACNMDSICRLARKHDLQVIEDCAHAIGAKYHKKHVGNFGVAGCFSFYPTKNITTIEGGMVITNSKSVAKYITSARNHGITKSLSQRYSHGKPWDYEMGESGYNYRLDEIRSSLGSSQLERISKLNSLRKKAFEYYNDGLGKIKGITVPSESVDSAHHLYIIRVGREFGVSRDVLFRKLLQQGIRTSVHYKPLHRFTTFKRFKVNSSDLKNSSKLYEEMLSLPFYPDISKMQQDYVINCIKKAASV